MITNQMEDFPAWYIQALLELNKFESGIMEEILSSRGGRKQIAAAAVSFQRHSGTVSAESLASLLRFSKSSDVLKECLGALPSEFIPSIYKQKDEIRQPSFYIGLAKWLSDQKSPSQLKALRHARRISLTTLAILDALDPVAIQPMTLSFIPNLHNAHILNSQIKFLRSCCSGITDDDLRLSIRRLGQSYGRAWKQFHEGATYFEKPPEIINFLKNKLVFPAAPIRPSKEILLLDSAKKMKWAGLKYRNCLGDRILSVVRQERYYFIWRSPPNDVIVELRNDPPVGFRVNEMESAGGGEVASETRAAISEFLHSYGIPTLPPWEDCLLEDVDSFHRRHFLRSWDQISREAAHEDVLP
nr:hypothetical protein [Neorhizobium tomejilense]